MRKKALSEKFVLPRKQDQDTICAMASPPGKAAISLIRISGLRAFAIGRKLCPFLPLKIKSHSVYFGTLVHPETRKALDEVLALCFEKGRSFTGEESLEISCHGSPFLVSSILEALQLAGARLAERGEFSLRAFMNGKINLIQAESILELINSRSPKAGEQALRGLKQGFSDRLKSLEQDLLKLLSHLEASIDFSAQDIEPFSLKEQMGLLKKIKEHIEGALKSFEQGKINKEGFSVVLLGAANAGKSSLFNYLIQEERAIVTKSPGTTRDILSARLLWNQREFCLKDTAGFRETPDQVEQKGVKKALEEAKGSDLCLFLVESSWPLKKQSFLGLEKLDLKKTHLIFSKSDKLSLRERKKLLQTASAFLKKAGFANFLEGASSLEKEDPAKKWVSVWTGEGVEDLKNFLYKKSEKEADEIFLSTPRQGRALKEIKDFLEKAQKLLKQKASPEFIAFELESALSVLYKLLGKEYNEEVIQNIFKEFCIGK